MLLSQLNLQPYWVTFHEIRDLLMDADTYNRLLFSFHSAVQSVAKNRFWTLADGSLGVVLHTLCVPCSFPLSLGLLSLSYSYFGHCTSLEDKDRTQQGTQLIGYGSKGRALL